MTTHTRAMAELYRLALFGPGAAGATFGNVLLRAKSELYSLAAAEPLGSSDAKRLEELAEELEALRVDIGARQKRLELVHDTLAHADAPTNRRARGSRAEREQRDAENRGDPEASPGR